MPIKRVVVAIPQRSLRCQIEKTIGRIDIFRIVSSVNCLMDTYNEVEEKKPDLVITDSSIASLPEFEVMRRLFLEANTLWLVIRGHTSASEKKNYPQEKSPHKKNVLFISSGLSGETLSLKLKDALSVKNHNAAIDNYAKPAHATKSRKYKAATDKNINTDIKRDAKTINPLSDSHRSLITTTKTRLTERTITLPGSSKSFPVSISPELRYTKLDQSDSTSSVEGSAATPVVLIGASTGGVDALLNVLKHFHADCPPTLIVQHTGTGFGESLAALLNRQCQANVKLAAGFEKLRRGTIVIGAGSRQHLILEEKGAGYTLAGETQESGHLPSVDVMFRSALPLAKRVRAALLTGMGKDGAVGLKALRDAGARTFVQNEESCVVFGMPRAALELNAAEYVLPLDEIGPALLQQPTVYPHLQSKETLR